MRSNTRLRNVFDALRRKADPFPSPEQYWYYAKFILHWRLIPLRRFQMSQVSAEFIPTRIAILTVSSRRGEEDDTSGHYSRDSGAGGRAWRWRKPR